MPSKFVLSSTATVLCGVLIGYFGMQFVKNNTSNSTSLASLSNESQIMKLGADQISKDYFDVRFDKNIVAEKGEQPSVIKVKITAFKDVPEGLHYKWLLGADANSKDILEGTLPAFQANEEKVFEISVFGFSKESVSHVSFSVSGALGDHPVKRDIIASSRPEDSYEYVLQQQALYQEQFITSGQNGKATQKSLKKGYRGQFDPDKIVR